MGLDRADGLPQPVSEGECDGDAAVGEDRRGDQALSCPARRPGATHEAKVGAGDSEKGKHAGCGQLMASLRGSWWISVKAGQAHPESSSEPLSELSCELSHVSHGVASDPGWDAWDDPTRIRYAVPLPYLVVSHLSTPTYCLAHLGRRRRICRCPMKAGRAIQKPRVNPSSSKLSRSSGGGISPTRSTCAPDSRSPRRRCAGRSRGERRARRTEPLEAPG